VSTQRTHRRTWTTLGRIIGVCVVLCFTAVYRFNTLGGRFGGFDNDHFVPFAYAKQVQAGAQPLRDFSGLGLQGAWPSLAYEASALAQRTLGNNLRSEAIVTIAGVSIAAALTFLAASLLSTPFWALIATSISVFVAPTLYNYPKVLMLSAVALVIAVYARRPTVGGICGAAALSAVAFLFRHDYAAYVGVGIVLACVVHGEWRRGFQHATLYVALTFLLLAPSLVYVERHAGLAQYVREGLELSRREADRTGLSMWPRFTFTSESSSPVSAATFFDVEQNGVAWLYYLTRLLPAVVLIVVWRVVEDRHRRVAALAIAAMAACASPFLIRGNVAVRLGDVGPLFSILFAIVCDEVVRRRSEDQRAARAIRIVLIAALLAGTALSARTVGYVGSQMSTAGLSRSFAHTRYRTQELWRTLGTLPEAALADGVVQSPLTIAQYFNRCTMPSDRIVMMTYEPEILPFAERLFGAGRLSVIPGYVLGERQERELVGFWQHESVPVALSEFEEFWNPESRDVPVIRNYLLANYRPAGDIQLTEDRRLKVFAHRQRAVVSLFGEGQLPCFR